MTQPTDGEEFTELVDANLPRVDLVGKGANGLPFLVAKSADGGLRGGLLPPEVVRDLVAKANPREDERELVVNLSGSPAAIAAMIHNAPIRKAEKETAVSDNVTKDDGGTDAAVEVSDIVETPTGGSTAESVPGSPDWEELDAATAENAIGVLGRAKAAIDWLATREETEAVTSGDADDSYNAWDLSDACASIDYAIRTLGAFAAGEKLEAGLAPEIAAVTKSIAGVEQDVAAIERLAPVAKAGRVLSSANEARIKSASDSLSEVLATLPAPIEDGLAVAKSEEETTVTDTVEKTATEPVSPELAAAIEQVEKAKDPQVAVYDANGKLVGTVSQDDIAPIAAPAAPEGGDAQGADTEPAPAAAAEAPGTQAAVPAGDDTTPAEPAAVGTPTAASDDDVAKATKTTDTETTPVAKSVAELVEEALKDHPVVKALQDEIAGLKAPAPSRVLRNGVIPADLTVAKRGQDDRDTDADVTKAQAEELQQQLAGAETVAQREAIAKQMQTSATQALAALHATRPTPAR